MGVELYEGYREIIVKKHNKILLIKFNNSKKKNALNQQSYIEIAKVFRTVANDETIVLVVITGVGDYFTAGNDLSPKENTGDFDEYMKRSNAIFKEMVSAVIDCPKVTVALVNGPCIGIGATLACLSDLVWCSNTTYFLTPFTKLGIVPEAASSYLFPLILGRSKASEMLLFSEKMNAEEALRYNFVSRVYDLSEEDTVVWPKLQEYSELPPGSLAVTKKLLRQHEKDILYQALDAECEELLKRFYTDEFIDALLKFSSRKKSKL